MFSVTMPNISPSQNTPVLPNMRRMVTRPSGASCSRRNSAKLSLATIPDLRPGPAVRARAAATGRSALPEPLRWDAERAIEARRRVLPRDDHRQLRDGVVVVVLPHAYEQRVVDVPARVGDCVGVFQRHL